MFKLENETDLYYKVVGYISRFYAKGILVATVGENQDTEWKRIYFYCKGYTKGSPDVLRLSYDKNYAGLCIEFENSNNRYTVSNDQLKLKNNMKRIVITTFFRMITTKFAAPWGRGCKYL